MGSGPIKGVDDLLDAVLADTVLYWGSFRIPLKLRYIMARYNKIARRLDVNLSNALMHDPRFLVRVTKRSGFMIVPKVEFEAWVEDWVFGDTPQQMNMARAKVLNQFWAKHNVEDLISINP